MDIRIARTDRAIEKAFMELRAKNPLEKIRELIESRKEAYESCADIIIAVDLLDMEEILEQICGKL